MYRNYVNGMIEVITGPMFSGKSEELIKRIKLLGYAGKSVLIIKPEIDDRWDKEKIISRCGAKVNTYVVSDIKKILSKYQNENYDAIAIDEAQFFDENLIDIVNQIANDGGRVIISALDMDYTGKPFGIVPQLLAIADNISKQAAVCFKCGMAATLSFRKTNSLETIEVGNDEYEARCRSCHQVGQAQK